MIRLIFLANIFFYALASHAATPESGNLIICFNAESKAIAQNLGESFDLPGVRILSFEEFPCGGGESVTKDFWNKKVPFSIKSYGAIVTPVPIDTISFTLSNLGAIQSNLPGFSLALLGRQFASFFYSHSDYRALQFADKFLPEAWREIFFTGTTLVYWTFGPMLYLAPIATGSQLVGATPFFLINEIMLSIFARVLNSLYEVEGMEHHADRLYGSYVMSLSILVPVFQAAAINILRLMNHKTYGGVAKLGAVSFLGAQILVCILLQTFYRKSIKPKKIPLNQYSASELRQYVIRRMSNKGVSFRRKYGEDIEFLFNYN